MKGEVKAIYKTVCEVNVEKFDEVVNIYLEMGYALYGSPNSQRIEDGYDYLCQALVKTERKQDD